MHPADEWRPQNPNTNMWDWHWQYWHVYFFLSRFMFFISDGSSEHVANIFKRNIQIWRSCRTKHFIIGQINISKYAHLILSYYVILLPYQGYGWTGCVKVGRTGYLVAGYPDEFNTVTSGESWPVWDRFTRLPDISVAYFAVKYRDNWLQRTGSIHITDIRCNCIRIPVIRSDLIIPNFGKLVGLEQVFTVRSNFMLSYLDRIGWKCI